MKIVEVILEDYLYEFYKKIGEQAGGMKVQQVLSDVLFRAAGKLALAEQERHIEPRKQ